MQRTLKNVYWKAKGTKAAQPALRKRYRRISLSIKLEELSLKESIELLTAKNKHLSTKELIMALSISGGVPKYLEEISKYKPLEKHLIQACFTKGEFFLKNMIRFLQIFLGEEKIL